MDPREAIREARRRLKQLAARAEAEAERLEAERTRLETELSRLSVEQEAWSAAGRPEAEEAAEILATLRARKAETEVALSEARRRRDEAEQEAREVMKLEPELERAEVKRIAQSALAPSIDERSAEQMALENVRHRLDQLEAEASLMGPTVTADSSGGSTPDRPDPRAQLEALKAARAQKGPPKPKRSM